MTDNDTIFPTPTPPVPLPDYRDTLPEAERRQRNLSNYGTEIAPHDQLLRGVEEVALSEEPEVRLVDLVITAEPPTWLLDEARFGFKVKLKGGRDEDLALRLGEVDSCLKEDESGQLWVAVAVLPKIVAAAIKLGAIIEPGSPYEFWVE